MSVQPAAASLEVRFEPVGGAGRPRAAAVATSFLVGALTLLLGAPRTLPLTKALICRRADGEVVASGPVDGLMRAWLEDTMRKDLRRLSETMFMARWGDPEQWGRLWQTWPPEGGHA